MQDLLAKQLALTKRHIYINPLEKCNLACKICYTKKTSPILPMVSIQEFVLRYSKETALESVTLCGGEVCTLPWLPDLVNWLTEKTIFVQIITNGTINILRYINRPNSVNWIVSLDGVPEFHDTNRGIGNFAKSTAFLRDAQKMGFHTEVFSIVVKQNYQRIDVFEAYLTSVLDRPVVVTYHPRKPPSYLEAHPISNVVGETLGFDFLDEGEMKELLARRKTFPPKDLGCFQIALMSDGRVFGCCEGVVPLGRMEEPIGVLIERLRKRLVLWERKQHAWGCLGCSQPDFVCGLEQYLSV